jgi:hypothetical protein
MAKKRTRLYEVRRYVVESYEVEVQAEESLSHEQICNRAIDPFAVVVIKESVRPRRPRGRLCESLAAAEEAEKGGEE